MKAKLTLAQRGLLLIAIPLSLQVVFLLIYQGLLDQANSLAEQEYRSKTVLGRMNWVTALVSNATLGSLGYVLTGDKRALGLYEACDKELPKELEAILNVVGSTPLQAERVNHCLTLIEKLDSTLTLLTKGTRDQLERKKLQDIVDNELVPTWTQLDTLRHQLLATEHNRIKFDVADLPNMRQLMKNLNSLLAITDVVIAAVLYLAYTRGITSRLAILSDNTKRLSKKQPLNEPLQGSDEVVQLDQAFHNMTRDLAQAQQRKQEYLQMINHDLRTPLTSISGSMELIETGRYGQLSEAGHKILTVAQGNLEWLLQLINELLEIEKMEAGMLTLEVREVSLARVCRRSMDSVRMLAESHELTLIGPRDDVKVKADENRLVQVTVNLLGNAIKFSPKGGKIVLAVATVDQTAEVKITDQGRGIPKEYIAKIFDRFQQVEEDDAKQKGGTGLGLAICKAIVEAHRGQIGVVSEEGKGSTFWYRIPLQRSDA